MKNTPEVKHALSRREVQDRLSISDDLLDLLIRKQRLRVWIFVEPYETYCPVSNENALSLIEATDRTKTIYCDLDMNEVEKKIDMFNRKNSDMEPHSLNYELMRFAPYEVDALIPVGFTFTNGFTNVSFQGVDATPSETQSKVIQFMWEQYLRGHLEIEQGQAYTYVGEQGEKRLSNTFKNSPLWNKLIIQSRPKFYRLNF